MNNVKQWYYLKGNLQNSPLYRVAEGVDKGSEKGNQIATYEDVFDIIDETHLKRAQVRNSRIMYNHINQIWYGTKEKTIKLHRDLCPTCFKHSKPPKSESYGLLHMLISDSMVTRHHGTWWI
jgi:hypothetical protein